ncbi:hypothetical protein [[Mycoplasma] imitans]|uniref:hypothetical protein n=1 Tax=[Mycoplasma] imitans TaxID=29560 RepID=UPI000489646D|nr:hypothetical protein [[Mycoplasma] imitans]
MKDKVESDNQQENNNELKVENLSDQNHVVGDYIDDQLRSNNDSIQNQQEVEYAKQDHQNNNDQQQQQNNNELVAQQSTNVEQSNHEQDHDDNEKDVDQKGDTKTELPPLMDEKTSFSISKLFEPSNLALLPIPGFINSYANNNTKQEENNGKFHLNYSDVTVDPIKNFYEKIVNSVDPLIEEYMGKIVNEDHQPFKQQQVLVDECNKINKKMKDLYKSQKILGRKIANVFIFISFFLIFGLALIPIYLKNKRIIKDFNNYENSRQNELNQLWWTSYGLSIQFASRINFNEIVKFIAKRLNLGFSNYCSQDTYQFISKCMDNFLDVQSSFIWAYKNTEITDCVANYKEWKMVTTSNAMSFPYTAVETYTTSNGRTATRTVTRYETLVAYHHERTPFFDDKHFQILKTNFKPELNFMTNVKSKNDKSKVKKFIMFENKEFSKTMRITNDNNEISADLLEFFTIKSQEDYLKWTKELNHDFNITKTGHFLTNDYVDTNYELDVITKPPKKLSKKEKNNLSPLYNYSSTDLNVAYHINKFNLKHLVYDKKQTIAELIEVIKQAIKYYVSDWAVQVTPFLLSPVINREWCSDDNNYKISNSGNFSTTESSKEKPSYDYLLNKVYNNGLIYFNKAKASTKAWFDINKINLDKEFLVFDIDNNSYHGVNEIDYVVVVGVHVGPKTIPVSYVRYYPVSEPKTVYFLPKRKDNNNNFIISNKKWNSFFDIANQSNIPVDNINKIKFNPNTSLEFLDPYRVLKDSSNQAYIDLLDQIQNNCTKHIHVQANDDGYFIFVNTTTTQDLEQEIFVKSIAKLKNNLLELRELES